MALDRNSAQAWCIVGNCFSLQREHEAAVKFFERAVQIDPSFTYAHTLLGHEYVYNEDLAKVELQWCSAGSRATGHCMLPQRAAARSTALQCLV